MSREAKPGARENLNWRDHPWIIAVVAGASVAVFFATVILPLVTQIDRNTIESLRREVELRESNAIKLKDAEATLASTESELDQARAEIKRLQAANPFKDADPYPVGLRLLRVGDDATLISEKYPQLTPTVLESWTELAFDSPFFGKVIFFSETGEGSRISMIMLHTIGVTSVSPSGEASTPSLGLGSTAVLRALEEEFGPPDRVGRLNGEDVEWCWFDRRATDIEVDRVSMRLTSSTGPSHACNKD